jgi:26S proteasome regulatory subunit N7
VRRRRLPRRAAQLKDLLETPGGGDWERKNRLKVYEGVYAMATRDFRTAATLFLDSLSTFTASELCSYATFVFYTVVTAVVSLDRVALKQRVVDTPEILAVLGQLPHMESFLNGLYTCKYTVR